jgi:hypothetical protein
MVLHVDKGHNLIESEAHFTIKVSFRIADTTEPNVVVEEQ